MSSTLFSPTLGRFESAVIAAESSSSKHTELAKVGSAISAKNALPPTKATLATAKVAASVALADPIAEYHLACKKAEYACCTLQLSAQKALAATLSAKATLAYGTVTSTRSRFSPFSLPTEAEFDRDITRFGLLPDRVDLRWHGRAPSKELENLSSTRRLFYNKIAAERLALSYTMKWDQAWDERVRLEGEYLPSHVTDLTCREKAFNVISALFAKRVPALIWQKTDLAAKPELKLVVEPTETGLSFNPQAVFKTVMSYFASDEACYLSGKFAGMRWFAIRFGSFAMPEAIPLEFRTAIFTSSLLEHASVEPEGPEHATKPPIHKAAAPIHKPIYMIYESPPEKRDVETQAYKGWEWRQITSYKPEVEEVLLSSTQEETSLLDHFAAAVMCK